MGPASSLVPPWWYSGTCLLFSSSLVAQWDPVLPYYFPTCKFIRGGTVGPNSNLFLPYFTISSLVVQWEVLPSGTVGPTPAKLIPYMQIRPW